MGRFPRPIHALAFAYVACVTWDRRSISGPYAWCSAPLQGCAYCVTKRALFGPHSTGPISAMKTARVTKRGHFSCSAFTPWETPREGAGLLAECHWAPTPCLATSHIAALATNRKWPHWNHRRALNGPHLSPTK